MKIGCLVFLLLLFLCFCNSNSKNGTDGEVFESLGVVLLEKLDSIRIDYLGNPTVHDLDPESGTVLFMEHKEFSEEIFIAGFDGKIRTSFSKLGDIPDGYGRLMSTLIIVDEKSFLAFGYNGFLTYDFEGEALSRVKLVDVQPPSYVSVIMGHGMGKLGEHYLYINQSFPVNKDYSDKNIYNDMYLLNLLDPVTGEKDPLIQFPLSSIFRNGKYFFRNAWDPVFHLADDRIYVAFGLEPVIYGFDDSPPYSLLSTFPLNLPEYRHFKGADSFSSDWTFFGLRFTSGMILNVKKFNEYFLVAYFPGYDVLDTETGFEKKSPEEAKIFRERMMKKYPARIAIIDSLGNMVNDFVPEGLEANSILVRNGELWMLEKPDEEVERDYFRLFRVGLKIDD